MGVGCEIIGFERVKTPALKHNDLSDMLSTPLYSLPPIILRGSPYAMLWLVIYSGLGWLGVPVFILIGIILFMVPLGYTSYLGGHIACVGQFLL